MNPEMLQSLAAFLGVEAEPAVILSALESVMAQLRDGTAGDGYDEEDVAAMMESVEAGSEDDLMTKFNAFASALREMMEGAAPTEDAEEVEDELVSGGKNFKALAKFNKQFAEAANTAPARKGRGREGGGSGVPHAIRDSHRQPSGGKSYKGIGQLGRAAKPTLQGMINDIKAGGYKAQSYQLGPTGGYILRQELFNEILPALRDAVPLFDMGVRQFPMQGLNVLQIAKVKTEGTAYWVGEGTAITESDETFETVTLVPKPLAARNIVPNQLLNTAVVNYEQQIRDDFVYQIQRAIMLAALEGSGSGATPRGIRNTTGVTVTPLGTNGAKPEIQDIVDMIGRIEDANVPIDDTVGLLLSPRSRRTFTSMTDGLGQPILRDGWGATAEDTLLGIPFNVTNAISNSETRGSSTNCSAIYGGVWRNLAIGMSDQIEIMVLRERLAHQLQTEIIAYVYVDTATLYEQAFQVLTGVLP